MNPHDALAKSIFSRIEPATRLLRAFLPPDLLAAARLDTLRLVPGTFIDEELREHLSDLVFEVQVGDSPLLASAVPSR